MNDFGNRRASLLPVEIGRVDEHHAKDDREQLGVNESREKSSEDCTYCGCNLKEHANAHVRVAFAHVGSGSARRGCDHGDEGDADSVADVNVKTECEEGNEEHSAAKAGKRAEQSRSEERRVGKE